MLIRSLEYDNIIPYKDLNLKQMYLEDKVVSLKVGLLLRFLYMLCKSMDQQFVLIEPQSEIWSIYIYMWTLYYFVSPQKIYPHNMNWIR